MNFELLKTLCETPSIPSREEQMRAVVVEEMHALTDKISIDAMGNVIGLKRGNGGPRVMIAAHIDEIGFIVKHIDDNGFIRIHPIGGWDPRTMVAQRVHVHGFAGQSLLGALMPASKPIHLMTADDHKKAPKIANFFVDVGLPGDKVKELVEIGDMVTMARTTERIGDLVMSKAMDNRISVFIMLEALRALKEHDCDILAVATVQEEIGLRGAVTAAFSLEPDIGIALDVTLAMDYPGSTESDKISSLGNGVAIKIVDSSMVSHPKLVRHLRDIAKKHDIAHQLEILPFGGTDAGGIQRSRHGVPSVTLSIPTRYVHTVNETAAVSDIEATISLLTRFLEEAHTRQYGYQQDIR